MISASFDGTLRLWNIGSAQGRELVSTEDSHGNALTDVVPLHSTACFTSSVDATLRLFSWRDEPCTERATCKHTFRGHTQSVLGVGYNGKERLFSFGRESEWRMWFVSQDRHPIDLKEMLL